MTHNIEHALEAIRLEKQALEQKHAHLQQELLSLTGQIRTLSLTYRQLSRGWDRQEDFSSGPYTGMTITSATVDVLTKAGKPLTTSAIATALREGGYLSTASRFNSMLHSILMRRQDTFGRTADGKGWELLSPGEEESLLEEGDTLENESIPEDDVQEDSREEQAVEALTKVLSRTLSLPRKGENHGAQ